MTDPRTSRRAPSAPSTGSPRISVRRSPAPDVIAPAMHRGPRGDRSQARLVLTLVFSSVGLSLFDLYQLATLMTG